MIELRPDLHYIKFVCIKSKASGVKAMRDQFQIFKPHKLQIVALMEAGKELTIHFQCYIKSESLDSELPLKILASIRISLATRRIGQPTECTLGIDDHKVPAL